MCERRVTMDAILPLDLGKSPGREKGVASFVTSAANEDIKFLDFRAEVWKSPGYAHCCAREFGA